MDFSGKKVLIVGLGILGGGVGTARYFAAKGAHVHVTDLQDEQKLADSLRELKPFPITYTLGRHDEKDLEDVDLLIKNPGVPSSSSFIQKAREKNIPVDMAESLFMKLSPTKNIIGVTGTRGKSTTSAMIFEILKVAGKKVFIAGNVKGTSTLELLDKLNTDSYVVLELSSWQLESFGWSAVSPHVAVFTNIYPDHLNRYSSMEEYIQAKANIFLHQEKNDYLVVNKQVEQDATVAQFVARAKSEIYRYPLDNFPEIAISLAGGKIGGHNWENANAAYKVASILGVEINSIKQALVDFHGLEGRMEHYKIIDGRIFINDTASTTPIAGIKALESIQPTQQLVLIIGGNSKNLPIQDLVRAIKKRSEQIKAIVYLKGNGTDALQKELETSGITFTGPFDSMKDTVATAYQFADNNDVILFSPSFTSFGQFQNEFERGDIYKKEIDKLQTAKK